MQKLSFLLHVVFDGPKACIVAQLNRNTECTDDFRTYPQVTVTKELGPIRIADPAATAVTCSSLTQEFGGDGNSSCVNFYELKLVSKYKDLTNFEFFEHFKSCAIKVSFAM